MIVDKSQLAQWVDNTYGDPALQGDILAATLTPGGPGVGQLRADILIPDEAVNRYVVVIRGTASAGNWLADLDARRIPSSILVDDLDGTVAPPKVHAGFARASEALTPHIATEIPAGAEVIIAGHSLGAAIALFLAPRLQLAGSKVTRVVTFGCPRVGDLAYRIAWHEQLPETAVSRVVNGPDPVCQLPTPLRGYRHIGDLHWYSYQGQLMSAGPWMRFGNRLGAYWDAWRDPGVDLIGYHSMGRYQRLLAGDRAE